MRPVRARDLVVALAAIEEARQGRGRSLFVTGSAGVGKSVFVGSLVDAVSSEWLVVRIEGAEQESRMVWAGLSQLVHRLRDHVAALKPAHRRIIEALVDPTTGPAPDAFAAAVSIHALLAQAAESRPTLVVVDDHHWLDTDSVRVLDFVSRRLDGLPVMLVATSRSTEVAGDAQLELGPLSDDEAVDLLTDHGLGVVTARELVALIGGHPLAIVQASKTLTVAQRAGVDPLPTPFPMSAEDLPGALVAVIRSLPDATAVALQLLSAAGALGRRWPDVLQAAGVDVDALTPAEDAGVITVASDSVRFVHPLFRALVYAEATPAARRAGHRSLAATEPDPGRALWHQARAVVGHDDALAARLAAVAEEAFRTGAHSSAFDAWHRASELAGSDIVAARYEIRAAEAALWAGNNAPAVGVVERRPPLESDDTALVGLAAAYEARAGHVDAAYALFVRAGTLLEDDDPDGAARAFLDASRTRLRTGHVAAASGALECLATVLARVTEPALLQQAEVVLAVVERMAGGPVERLNAACAALVPAAGPLSGDLAFLADTVALALAFLRQRTDALDLIERLREAAAERNLPSLIPYIDTAKACALNSVDLPGCSIAASNAVEWADAIGQPNLATAALGYLANVQAALGDTGVFTSAARIGAAGTENAWVTERMARGYYWTTMGQPERVLEELLPLHEWSSGELKTVMFWQADLGEAAVRSGRIDIAEAVVQQLRDFHSVFPNRWLEGAAARIGGLLADVDSCGTSFEISIAAFAAGEIRLGEARSELLWGERLRRFLKPVWGQQGKGGERWVHDSSSSCWSRREMTLNHDGLLAHCRSLAKRRPVLVQECLSNHSDIERFSTGPLCTFRAMTYCNDDGRATLLALTFKMASKGSDVDNLHAGGLVAAVDASTGQLGPGITRDPTDGPQRVHPETHEEIEGARLTTHVDVISVALKAHERLDVPWTVGWDIAMTPSGPVIVEGNPGWGIDLYHMPHGVGLETHFAEELLRRVRAS